ncbi:MAG: class I SAM-dependent methyltransferase [Polyangiaceae bacterium]
MSQPRERVERGDWQTPDRLAEDVLGAVRLAAPACVLEPTCGDGAFLAAAARLYPRAKLIGYDLSSTHIAVARARLPASRTTLEIADFFDVRWDEVIARLPRPILVAGNPPWVTSTTIGKLAGPVDAPRGRRNLPPKSNFKRHAGLDAMTGKANFDVSEWMLLCLLEALRADSAEASVAMLCKASVARRVLEHCAREGWSMTGELRTIDSRKHFAAMVDAVALYLAPRDDGAPMRWRVYSSLEATTPSSEMGVVDGRVSSDVAAHRETQALEGRSELTWRSGLKHDCRAVMELARTEGGYENGFGERVDLEPDFLFPWLKGSDVANGRLEPARVIVVPQRRLGEDTSTLRERAPRLWRYLERHRDRLDARKSRIYRDAPPFSIFGVGDYTFAPFKVAICGLYKRLSFVVVDPVAGQPTLVDDTVYFLPCKSVDSARALADALSSPRARAFFEARIFWDEKRPIAKSVLERLSLRALFEELETPYPL